MFASQYLASKYLNGENLTAAKKFRIKDITEETLGQGANAKVGPVLWFTNSKLGLPLNKTNLRTLKAAFGDDMKLWKNEIITVFPTKVEFGPKLVDGLRIRIPPPKEGSEAIAPAPAPAPASAQQKSSNGSAAPAQPTAAEPTTTTPTAVVQPDPDLDDEIPF
jgi:hypothetical protein